MSQQVSEQMNRLQLQLGDGAPPVFSSMSAIVSEGTIRRHHGLAVTLKGHGCTHSIAFKGKLSADIHGRELFSSLPNGFGLLAPSFLPFELNLESERFEGGIYEAKFTIAGSVLSRGRVDQVLAHIRECGDHPFVFEFRNAESGKVVGFLPTKASYVERSLRLESERGTYESSERNIEYTGQLPVYHKKGSVHLWVNWLKFMLLFSVLCWSVLIAPNWLLSTAPDIIFYRDAFSNSSLAGVLPLCPTNMSSAYVLGGLAEQLQTHVTKSANAHTPLNDTFVNDILRASELAVGRPPFSVTMADLANVPQEIYKLEHAVSLLTRVRGFFSFVNMIWLVAILGITISIGPAIFHLLRPIQQLLKRLCVFILNEIIYPTVTRLHSYGIFEALGYCVCILLLTQGVRMKEMMTYEHDSAAGFYVSLTGCMLSVPCAFYSTFLWGNRPIQQISEKRAIELFKLWLGISWIPIAICFSSTLVGYAVVALIYTYLGFTVMVGHLVVIIGFETYDQAARVCVTSLLTILGFTFLRVANSDVMNAPWLHPFLSPIAVFGGILYFLAMLILCEKDFSRDCGTERGRNYSRRRENHAPTNLPQRLTASQKHFLVNLAMACSLGFFSFIGFVFQVEAFVNTAVTFGVLWVCHRYIMFHTKNNFSPWILILLMSLLMWKISLYLHAHPHFIVSILQIGAGA
jgi:hypothetical protein